MAHWFVTYSYRGSRYFDSPLFRRTARVKFDSYAEAWEWADNGRPDIPDFKLLCIHEEPDIVDHGPHGVHPDTWEARHVSDHCTDMAILRK